VSRSSLLGGYKYDFISAVFYIPLSITNNHLFISINVMQLFTILPFFFLGCIYLFSNDVVGREVEFPIQACANAFYGGNFSPCANALAKQIMKLHHYDDNTPYQLCDFSCRTNLKGRFSRWEWKWDAKFQCNSKAPGIVGVATKYSRDGAIEWAIEDFLKKAYKANRIKEEDVSCWNKVS
jgi:hypothetical protein